MTVSQQISQSEVYIHDGVQDTYSFPFDVTDPTEVVIWISSDGGVTEVLATVFDYGVTLNTASPGGTITWTQPTITPANEDRFRIVRSTPQVQDYNVSNTAEYHPAALEPALDTQIRIDQENGDDTVLRRRQTQVETSPELVALITQNRADIDALAGLGGRVLLASSYETLDTPAAYAELTTSADADGFGSFEVELGLLGNNAETNNDLKMQIQRGGSLWTGGSGSIANFSAQVVDGLGAASQFVGSAPPVADISLIPDGTYSAGASWMGRVWIHVTGAGQIVNRSLSGTWDMSELDVPASTGFRQVHGGFAWSFASPSSLRFTGVRFFANGTDTTVSVAARLWGHSRL